MPGGSSAAEVMPLPTGRPGNTCSIFITEAKVVAGQFLALPGSSSVPVYRPVLICFHSFAIEICITEANLCCSNTLSCRQLIPLHHFLFIHGYHFSLTVKSSDIELGIRVPLLRRFHIPAEGFFLIFLYSLPKIITGPDIKLRPPVPIRCRIMPTCVYQPPVALVSLRLKCQVVSIAKEMILFSF